MISATRFLLLGARRALYIRNKGGRRETVGTERVEFGSEDGCSGYKRSSRMAAVPIHNRTYSGPLHEGDTLLQTVGCRHSKPQTCARSSLANVCAYVRADGMCVGPPESWPRQYRKFRVLPDEREDEV